MWWTRKLSWLSSSWTGALSSLWLIESTLCGILNFGKIKKRNNHSHSGCGRLLSRSQCLQLPVRISGKRRGKLWKGQFSRRYKFQKIISWLWYAGLWCYNQYLQIYMAALYPNTEADVSRDLVLQQHIGRLSEVVSPNHRDLKIPRRYQYECPWPAAQVKRLFHKNTNLVWLWNLLQAELRRLAAFKLPADKVNCISRWILSSWLDQKSWNRYRLEIWLKTLTFLYFIFLLQGCLRLSWTCWAWPKTRQSLLQMTLFRFLYM